MKKASLVSVAVMVAASSILGAMAACGSSNSLPTGNNNGGDGGDRFGDGGVNLLPNGGDGGGPGGPCSGLQCQIHSCPGTTTGTQITGHVYDPAGNNVLFNVVAYVPNAPTDPLPVAPANECGSCDSLYSGSPIASGITQPPNGEFIINNAPDGTNIPLVIQIGKWRTQLVIPTVTACGTGDTNNLDKSLAPYKVALPSLAGVSTAQNPTNGLQQDIPEIAISTGGADSLECLLLRIGVNKKEYADGPGGTGHLHIFKGSPVPPTAGNSLPNPAVMSASTPLALSSLWDKQGDLSPYDILILSCEGDETVGVAGGDSAADGGVTVAEQTAIQQFTNAGGRAFLSHFHYSFLDTGPFANPPLATWTPGPNPISDDPTAQNPTNTTLGDIVTTLPDGGNFAKGSDFFIWLGLTNSLQGVELPIDEPKHNADVSAADIYSQSWIKADQNASAQSLNGTFTPCPGATQYFSWDTPLNGAGTDDAGATIYCGRVVYSDLHVGSASDDYPGVMGGQTPIVPSGCANNALSPQEKALEYMLFDLSSCVTPDTGPAQGPPPTPIK